MGKDFKEERMERSRSRSRSRERDFRPKKFSSRSNKTNEFLQVRAKMRAEIFENGTEKAWARSPSPISSDSDIEEHVKKREKSMKIEFFYLNNFFIKKNII